MLVDSKYFQGEEMRCRCGCGRQNMDDMFMMKLNVFRDMVGGRLRVTSGGRCIEHNASPEVGGQPGSCHICEGRSATGADVEPLDHTLAEIFALACASGLFNEVILYKSKGFIHLGIDDKKLRPYYEVK